MSFVLQVFTLPGKGHGCYAYLSGYKYENFGYWPRDGNFYYDPSNIQLLDSLLDKPCCPDSVPIAQTNNFYLDVITPCGQQPIASGNCL
jgi:hypothetical protein